MSLTRSVETAAPAAFESLYQGSFERLTQQTFLLTGNPSRARHCVRRAFELAWSNWDEVSTDPSPEGWVRAAAFELALSPWRTDRFHRTDPELRLDSRDQQLLTVLRRLPAAQRRALVLHDALGLSWQETASEIEASTPAAYGRVVRARLGVARLAPDLLGPDGREPGFGRRLGRQLRGTAVRGCPSGDAGTPPPERVRRQAGMRERAITTAAGLATVAVVGGVLAGLAVGTPWHPSAPAFVGRPAPVHGAARAAQSDLLPPSEASDAIPSYVAPSHTAPSHPAPSHPGRTEPGAPGSRPTAASPAGAAPVGTPGGAPVAAASGGAAGADPLALLRNALRPAAQRPAPAAATAPGTADFPSLTPVSVPAAAPAAAPEAGLNAAPNAGPDALGFARLLDQAAAAQQSESQATAATAPHSAPRAASRASARVAAHRGQSEFCTVFSLFCRHRH